MGKYLFTTIALLLISNIIGAIAQPVFGWLVSYHWTNVYKNGTPFYGYENFSKALLIFPVSFLIALLISGLFITEAHSKEKVG